MSRIAYIFSGVAWICVVHSMLYNPAGEATAISIMGIISGLLGVLTAFAAVQCDRSVSKLLILWCAVPFGLMYGLLGPEIGPSGL